MENQIFPFYKGEKIKIDITFLAVTTDLKTDMGLSLGVPEKSTDKRVKALFEWLESMDSTSVEKKFSKSTRSYKLVHRYSPNLRSVFYITGTNSENTEGIQMSYKVYYKIVTNEFCFCFVPNMEHKNRGDIYRISMFDHCVRNVYPREHVLYNFVKGKGLTSLDPVTRLRFEAHYQKALALLQTIEIINNSSFIVLRTNKDICSDLKKFLFDYPVLLSSKDYHSLPHFLRAETQFFSVLK